MRLVRYSVPALALAALLASTGQRLLAEETKRLVPNFGALEQVSEETARGQLLAWLKSTGKADAANLAKFETLWKQSDRPVLDRVAETFALTDENVAKMLREARDPLAAAPLQVPAFLKDAKAPAFYRTNLTLAYARLLSNRRVHEEALEALKLIRAEDVVDPATYLFQRAVCEHALLQKDAAGSSINTLLDRAASAPDRYKAVGLLMLLDMQTWKDKDLASIARKMDNVERRLELARGGPQTQKLQREIIARLDELIKEKENKAKGQGQGQGDPNKGGCPDGSGGQQQAQGSKPGNNPSSPMPDTNLNQGAGGSGRVDQAKLRLTEQWGTLPERERARALQDLTRGMTASHREAIENYFRNLAQATRR